MADGQCFLEDDDILEDMENFDYSESDLDEDSDKDYVAVGNGTDSDIDSEFFDADSTSPSPEKTKKHRPRGAVSEAISTPSTLSATPKKDRHIGYGSDSEESEALSTPSTFTATRKRANHFGYVSGSRVSEALFSPTKRRRGRPKDTRCAQAETAAGRYTNWRNVTSNDEDGPDIPYNFRDKGSGGKDLPQADSKPIEYFKLFFTEELVKMIVDETNKYADKKIQETLLSPHSRLHQWENVTVPEMYLVIGLLLNMEIVKLPRLTDYWSESPQIRVDYFRKAMSRNRFQNIFKSLLHCYDIDESKRGKGDKIQPIINYIVTKFQQHFIPYQQLSADVSMIGYKGFVQFRQYNPRKPVKWGLLARTLADAKTGYLLNIMMYYGKVEQKESFQNLTKPSSTIIELLGPYLNKGYHVFCDRLYTSLDLADHLHNKRTYLTGTIRANRSGIPAQIKANKKGIISMRSGKILLQNWIDKRQVIMISTYYRGDELIRKKMKTSEKIVEKPLAVEEYNQYMGGVDLSDQNTSYYNFSRKSELWWKKMFFWLLEICVTNSYLLYKQSRPEQRGKNPSLLSFRQDLVPDLVDLGREHFPRQQRERPLSSTPGLHPSKGYFHVQKKREPGQRARECKFCSERRKNGRRKDTRYYCDTCQGKPGLHPGDCFSAYHIQSLNNHSLFTSSIVVTSEQPNTLRSSNPQQGIQLKEEIG
uniref:piggyBac transposable element-derived protein 4-like n=1 Tax=Styela clava TaxID=7725 RepID=UPI00193AA8EB|nr:piggyBac transposable element-derived protein 4-like [Styela clava]